MENFMQKIVRPLLIGIITLLFSVLGITQAFADLGGFNFVTKFEKKAVLKCDHIEYALHIETRPGPFIVPITVGDNWPIGTLAASTVNFSGTPSVIPTQSMTSSGWKVVFPTPVNGGAYDINWSSPIDPTKFSGGLMSVKNQAILSQPGSPDLPSQDSVKGQSATIVEVNQKDYENCKNQNGGGPVPTPSCLDGKADVICGKVLGTYDIIIHPNGLGGVIPTSVTITPLTPGITLSPAQSSYAVVGGVVQVNVLGAHPGDILSFDVSGTTAGGGSAAGTDLCCNGTIKIEIPTNLPCKPLIPVDLSIKKTGGTTPAPDVPAYSFSLAVSNEGAAFTAPTGTLTVTDTVPAGMQFNTVTPAAPWTCTPGGVLPTGTTVTCTNSIGPVVMPAGPAALITTIAINATALGKAPFPDFTNCSDVALNPLSGYGDTVPPNNHSCVTLSKNPKKADVTLEKICDKAKSVAGGGFEAICHINVTTNGVIAQPINFDEAFFGAATVSYLSETHPWVCTPPSVLSPLPIHCNLPGGTLTGPTNVSTVDFKVAFTNAADANGKLNCVTGTYDSHGLERSCTPIVVTPPELKIEKTGLKECVANTPCPFTINITSVGQAYSGNILLSDVLTPAAAWPITSIVPNVCGTAPTNMPFACVANVNLAANTPLTITITLMPATVNALSQDENCITAAFVGPNVPVGPISAADVQALSTSGQISTPVQSCWKFTENVVIVGGGSDPDVSMVKSWTKGANPFAGKFTFKVKNESANPIATPQVIKIVDQVPPGMTITNVDASVGTNWTCAPTTIVGPAALTCTYGGAMPVAASATLPDLVLNATLAAATPPKTEPAIYANCATTNVFPTATATSASADATPANNKSCAVTETITKNCLMDGTCPPPPPLTCKSDVLLVVDRSASILDSNSINNAINHFIQPMNGKGGKLEVLYFASKGAPVAAATETVLPQTVMGSPTVPSLVAASGGYTNWDNALQVASTKGSGKFVIFITDGEPTAYDSAPGVEVAPAASIIQAANEAAPWINAIRMGGSRLLVLGFGPVSSMGYLEATFGGNVGGDINADIIKVANESALDVLMTKLGRQTCGTLNLSKTAVGQIFDTIPITDANKFVTGDIKFQVGITNNSTSPITSIVVEDQFQPTIQAGMPSDAAFTNPVLVGTPSLGTAAIVGHTLSWSIPTLAAGQSASVQFKTTYSGTHTQTGTWDVPNFAQVKAAVGDSQSTAGNMANPLTGPVHEADEASANGNITVIKLTPQQGDPCLSASKPAYCYVTAEKSRVVQEGTCFAGQACGYKFNVAIDPKYLPANASIKITDKLTLNGTAVNWPATVTQTPATPACVAAPTNLGFTCTAPKPPGTSPVVTLTFAVNIISIPAGTTGTLKNCIEAEITGTGTALDGTKAPASWLGLQTGQLCTEHVIPSTAKTINPVLTLTCDAATTVLSGNTCRCIIQGQVPVSNTACGCPNGQQLRNGRCEVPPPVCGDNTHLDLATGRCVPNVTNCPLNTHVDPATGKCVDNPPRCTGNTHLDPNSGKCVDNPPVCTGNTHYEPALGKCVENPPRCTGNTHLDPTTGKCVDNAPVCRDGTHLAPDGKRCVANQVDCPAGTHNVPGTNRCDKDRPTCRDGQQYDARRNICFDAKPVCGRGTHYEPSSNSCVQNKVVCGRGQKLNPDTNRCETVRPICEAPFVYNPRNNSCIKVEQPCPPGTIKLRGICLPIPRLDFPTPRKQPQEGPAQQPPRGGLPGIKLPF